MHKDYSLREFFKSDFERLSELRLRDPVLDEICRDYDLLASDLTERHGTSDDQVDSLVADIQASLHELAQEIRNALDASVRELAPHQSSQIEER